MWPSSSRGQRDAECCGAQTVAMVVDSEVSGISRGAPIYVPFIEGQANAHLIAAAPCLLAELQAIHDSAPACWWNLPIEQQQRIKAALAKATQEQPK